MSPINVRGNLAIAVLMLLFVGEGLLAADRFWVAAAPGDWTDPANWSLASGGAGGASVPGAADRARFNGLRVGDCELRAPVTVGGILIEAGYTGTISQGPGQPLSVGTQAFSQAAGTWVGNNVTTTINGAFALSGGSFTATSGTLAIAGNYTHTLGGAFLANGGTVSLTGAAATVDVASSETFFNLTLGKGHGLAVTVAASDVLVVQGRLSLSDGLLNQSTVASGGTISAQGNVVQESGFDGGTGTLALSGSIPQIVIGNATRTTGLLPNLLFRSSSTVALEGTLRSARNWTYSSGVVAPGTSTVVFAGTLAINGSHGLGNVVFDSNSASNVTITLSGTTTLTVLGSLLLGNSSATKGALAVNTGTISAQGSITVADQGNYSGSATLLVNGSADQAFSCSATRTVGGLPKVNINKPSGTLSLSGLFRVVQRWTWTAGAVAPGSSTVVFGPGVTVTGSHTLGNVTFDANSSGATAVTIASGTTLGVSGALLFDNSGTGAMAIQTGTVAAQGPITVADAINYAGTATLLINGTGDQLLTSAATALSGGLPAITVNKPSGILSLSGTLRLVKNWNRVAGALSAGFGPLVIADTLTVTGSQSWGDLAVNSNSTAAKTLTLAAGTTLTVTGTLALDNTLAGSFALNGGTIAAQGAAIAVDDRNHAGSTLLLINGTGNQTLTGAATPLAGTLPAVTINKPSGTLFLSGTLRTGRNWTCTAGALEAGTSTLILIDTLSVSGTQALNHLTLNSNSTAAKTITLAAGTSLTVNGLLTLDNTLAGAMALNGGTIQARGDLVVDNQNYGGTTSLVLNGSGPQTFTGGATATSGGLPAVTINKPAGALLTLSGTLRTGKNWTWQAGSLEAGASTLIFCDTLTVNGSQSLGNLTFNTNATAGKAITIASGSLLTVKGDLVIDNTLSGVMTLTGALAAQGNVNADSSVAGTATLTLTGAKDQVLNLAKLPSGAVTVNKGGGGVVLAAALPASAPGQALTLSSGLLDLAGFNLTVGGALTVGAAGTLKLQGGESVTRGSLVLQPGSTVVYSGSGTYAGLALGNSYQHLYFQGAGSWRQTAALTAVGNLGILQGTLDSAGWNIALGGSWSNSGTFLAGGNTVQLTGPNQSILGQSTFHHLVKSSGTPSTLTFEHGKTQKILGTLTLLGDTGGMLTLQSDVPGSQWQILPEGERVIAYVAVGDSEHVGYDTIEAGSTCQDLGNNVRWVFSGSSYLWSGRGPSSNFNDSANWFGEVVPGSTDTAVFNGAGVKDCTLDTLAGPLLLKRLEVRTTYPGTLVQASGGSLTAVSFLNEGRFVLGANGALVLTGHGRPLSGAGLLDATTHAPNTVTYAGDEAIELAAGAAVPAYHHLELAPPTGLSRYDTLLAEAAECDFDSAAIDLPNGFAYFGSMWANPCRIVKVRLSDFTRVGGIVLNSGERMPGPSFIDGGYLYVGMRTAPGRIVKIRLSDFTRVGALTLAAGEDSPISVLNDRAGGHAYFGTQTAPGRIVKVRLSDFTRVGALTLPAGDDELVTAVQDEGAGYGCFVTRTAPGKVLRLRYADFTIDRELALQAEDDKVHSGVIDPGRGYAYFGTQAEPGRIVRVRLSDLSRVDSITLLPGEEDLRSAVIDPDYGHAYFGTNTNVGIIVKVNLDGFSRVESIALGNNEANLYLSAVIDQGAGFAYFPTNRWVGTVVKVNLRNRMADWSQNEPLHIGGDLAIGRGRLRSHSQDLTLAGNWSNAGTYLPGMNTVTLAGGDQSVLGHNAFNNLIKSGSAGERLTFESGKVQALGGRLDLRGVPGNRLRVGASVAGQAWRLDAAKAQAFSQAEVRDTDASAGATVHALDSLDGGNNRNVIFSVPAQLAILTPAYSATSPAWIEGDNGGDVTAVVVQVNDGAGFLAGRLSQTRWFADNASASGAALGVALSPSAATRLSVTAVNEYGGSSTVTQEVAWLPTDLSGKSFSVDRVTIRKGDSLLLTAQGAGSTLALDLNGDGVPDYTGMPGQNFAHAFHSPGSFVVRARVDGVEVGSLTVVVLYVDLSKPIACEVGFQRQRNVVISPAAQASSVQFGVNDPGLLSVSVRGPFNNTDGQGLTLNLKALRRGAPVLTARTEAGPAPLLAYREVDEFTVDFPALWTAIFDAGSGKGPTRVTMRPYIANLEFQFRMFAATATFAGGATSLALNTSALDPETGETLFRQEFDPETGEVVGRYDLDLELPPGEDKYCFTAQPWQASSIKVPVGQSGMVNGMPCIVEISQVVLPVGLTTARQITVTVVKANEEATTKYRLKLLSGGREATPTEASFSPGTGGWEGVLGTTEIDLSKEGATYTEWVLAGDVAKKYAVMVIDPATAAQPQADNASEFSDRVLVVKVDDINHGGRGVKNTIVTVPKGDTLVLTAMPEPRGSGGELLWPSGWPRWWINRGSGKEYLPAFEGMPTLSLELADPKSYTVYAGCGTSLVEVTVLVIEVTFDKNPVVAPLGVATPAKVTATITPAEARPYIEFKVADPTAASVTPALPNSAVEELSVKAEGDQVKSTWLQAADATQPASSKVFGRTQVQTFKMSSLTAFTTGHAQVVTETADKPDADLQTLYVPQTGEVTPLHFMLEVDPTSVLPAQFYWQLSGRGWTPAGRSFATNGFNDSSIWNEGAPGGADRESILTAWVDLDGDAVWGTGEPRLRIKVFVFKLELVTPKGSAIDAPRDSGDGQNRFVFDASAKGRCAIAFKASITPSTVVNFVKDNIFFSIEGVGESTFTWGQSNPGGKATFDGSFLIASATFEGLPSRNNSFGNKTAALNYFAESQELSITRVLYTANATNHPGGVAGDPNWYYYWTDALANGPHTYEAAVNWGVTRPPNADVFIGDNAFGAAGIPRHAAERFIDCFGIIVNHEMWHRGHRLHNIGVHGGWAPPAGEDVDGDAVCDREPGDPPGHTGGWEAANGTDPNNANTNGDVDREWIAQQNETDPNGTNMDWAHPGSQFP